MVQAIYIGARNSGIGIGRGAGQRLDKQGHSVNRVPGRTNWHAFLFGVHKGRPKDFLLADTRLGLPGGSNDVAMVYHRGATGKRVRPEPQRRIGIPAPRRDIHNASAPLEMVGAAPAHPNPIQRLAMDSGGPGPGPGAVILSQARTVAVFTSRTHCLFRTDMLAPIPASSTRLFIRSWHR